MKELEMNEVKLERQNNMTFLSIFGIFKFKNSQNELFLAWTCNDKAEMKTFFKKKPVFKICYFYNGKSQNN